MILLLSRSIKGKDLFQPIRLALTGKEHGPELGLIAYVIGKEEVKIRINTSKP